jgi:hypothetical protein
MHEVGQYLDVFAQLKQTTSPSFTFDIRAGTSCTNTALKILHVQSVEVIAEKELNFSVNCCRCTWQRKGGGMEGGYSLSDGCPLLYLGSLLHSTM